MVEEVKEMQKGIQDILVAIGQIQTEIRHLSDMSADVKNTTLTSVRLERDITTLTARVVTLELRIEADNKAAKEDKKWLLGFLVGAIALVWKLFDYTKGGL